MKLKFEENLPDFIQIMERRRETRREIDRRLAEIREHWSAMLAIPEIAEKAKDICQALTYEDFLPEIDKKIEDAQTLPLPIIDKNEVIAEWKEIKRQIIFHGERLVEAEGFFPLGYVSFENGNPEATTIKPKDRKEIEDKGATVAVPDAAKELYQVFMRVVDAANEFENYQFNHNLNVRDFLSVITHVRDAEDFAKNWVNGTWKRY